jgi:hypothetical protein
MSAAPDVMLRRAAPKHLVYANRLSFNAPYSHLAYDDRILRPMESGLRMTGENEKGAGQQSCPAPAWG